MSINVFISYSPADDAARQTLDTHLAALQRSRLIRTWTAHQIGPGQEWRAAVDKSLDEAHLILLLISPDFLASDACYNVEMKRALERHRAGVARVIPIIVRHVDWRGTPVDGLKMLPENARPVSSTGWGTIDKAWTNVAISLRRVVEEMMGGAPSHASPSARSFVEERESYAKAPPPQPASAYVAPSSARLPTRSRPAMAGPRSSQRSTRVQRGPSRLPWLAALVVAVAGGAAGAWTITRSTTADTTITWPTTADTTTCCGGSACAPDRQDTRGSMCEKKTPDKCASCPSRRELVEGACRAPIEPSQRFLLRLARLDLPKGTSPAPARVCVRLAGAPVNDRQCTLATDASDSHVGSVGNELLTRLPVSVADLIETGRGLEIEVEIPGQPPLLSPAHTLKGPDLLRSALCQGVTYPPFGGVRVSFYLDDA